MELITPPTHDTLPQFVFALYQKVESIRETLTEKNGSDQPEWMDLDAFCAYHPAKPKKPTVYRWVSDRTVPHHKRGRSLLFLRSEINEWLKQGRQQTASEIAKGSINSLKSLNRHV